MVEELLLHRVGAGDHLGRLLQPDDPIGEQVVELPPHRMRRVGRDLEQRALDAGDHLRVHPLVHESRHPPGALRVDPAADELLVLHDESGEAVDHPVEQLLVAVVGREEEEPLGQHRRDRPLAERLDHAPLEQRVDVLVLHHVGGAPQRRRGVAGERAGVLGAAEPLGHPTAGLHRQQLGAQHLGREEVVLDEVAEGAADPVLPRGMIAVWGMGMLSGWRKSAVMANQSASPPTMAASAVART